MDLDVRGYTSSELDPHYRANARQLHVSRHNTPALNSNRVGFLTVRRDGGLLIGTKRRRTDVLSRRALSIVDSGVWLAPQLHPFVNAAANVRENFGHLYQPSNWAQSLIPSLLVERRGISDHLMLLMISEGTVARVVRVS